MKRVGVDVDRVEKPDVSFSLLGLDKDGFQTFQVFPSFQVPLDIGSDTDEPVAYLFRLCTINDSRVERLELVNQDRVKYGTGHAPAQLESIVRRQIRPAGFCGVLHERILDCCSFATDRHQSTSA